MKGKELRLVFMGTPSFALPSLKALSDNGYKIAGVVTAPDRPAGRGLRKRESPVKQFARARDIALLQPENLSDDQFIRRLHLFEADLFAVVAFRILPEEVWAEPPLGTINLHASLLPQYRGAAPIQRAIMNGEKETGLTTFFIRKEVDTGDIILQQKVKIGADETAGELQERMGGLGGRLMVDTVHAIEKGKASFIRQETLAGDAFLKRAPKITREDCRIVWNRPSEAVYNQIRGLSPIPGSFTEICSPAGERFHLKIFACRPEAKAVSPHSKPGDIVSDGKETLKIATSGGAMRIMSLQLAGKKRMDAAEFLRGFRITENWKAI